MAEDIRDFKLNEPVLSILEVRRHPERSHKGAGVCLQVLSCLSVSGSCKPVCTHATSRGHDPIQVSGG